MDCKYKEELSKLIDIKDNFEFFRKFVLKHRLYNPEIFKQILDEILKFSKENNLDNVRGWTYYCLGWYYCDKSDYSNGLDAFLVSKDTFEIINDKKGLIYACNGLTFIYCQIGQFKLANEWGLKGISLAEEINEKDALLILLLNTGINYIHMKQFQKARNVFNNIEIMDYELSKQHQSCWKLSVAEIEINIGNPKIALVLLEEISDLDTELSTDTSEVYRLKGMAYVKLNEYDIANKEFMKGYDFSAKQDYTYEKCCVMIESSKLSFTVGRPYEAIKTLNEVLKISEFSKFKVLLKQAYNILYGIYKDINNTKEALIYLEKYMLIYDEMYDYEQNQLMAKMNIKHTEREAHLYKLLYDKTEFLSNIGQKIISNLDINCIINIIGKEINKLIETDVFGIAIYDNEKGKVVYNFVNEKLYTKKVMSFDIDSKSTFSTYCIKNKTDIIINNVEEEFNKYSNTDWKNSFEGALEKSMIYTPLIINDKVVGVMTVQSYNEYAYDKNDLNTLKIIANYSAIAIDNAMSYKKIEDIATYDFMTGFLTRFEIIRLGEIIYEKHKDNNIKFSVIMIDIDNFKAINDIYGHVYGDKAINLVTETISKCIRATDYIGRYGGDEFLLICPDADQQEAIEVAERIRNTIFNRDYIIGENMSVKITLSLGVYEFRKNDMSFIDGVKMADKYLYNAKKGSKNKVVSKTILAKA